MLLHAGLKFRSAVKFVSYIRHPILIYTLPTSLTFYINISRSYTLARVAGSIFFCSLFFSFLFLPCPYFDLLFHVRYKELSVRPSEARVSLSRSPLPSSPPPLSSTPMRERACRELLPPRPFMHFLFRSFVCFPFACQLLAHSIPS